MANLNKIFKQIDTVLEKDIEQYLCREVKKLSGTAYKFNSKNYASVPDRLCLFPGGRCYFVECKKPGGVPTARQKEELEKLTGLGFSARVIDTKGKVDQFILEVKIDLEFNAIKKRL